MMSNPTVETDLAQILSEMNQKLDKLSDNVIEIKINQAKIQGQIEAVDQKLSGKIEAVDQKLSGKIEAVDQKLSGKIEAVDQKLSGQIKALDTKVEQLDKRVGNQEFASRGILVGIVVIVLGGAAKLFGWVGNP